MYELKLKEWRVGEKNQAWGQDESPQLDLPEIPWSFEVWRAYFPFLLYHSGWSAGSTLGGGGVGQGWRVSNLEFKCWGPAQLKIPETWESRSGSSGRKLGVQGGCGPLTPTSSVLTWQLREWAGRALHPRGGSWTLEQGPLSLAQHPLPTSKKRALEGQSFPASSTRLDFLGEKDRPLAS